MKWVSHIGIAAATCAVINPVAVPAAMLGATAPDWLEWVAKYGGLKLRHRAQTHYVVFWIGLMLFGLLFWDFRGLLAAFAWGGLTHVLCDACTVSGVPFAPWSRQKFHLFGGRLRTGDPAEYFITGTIVLFCAALVIILGVSGFYPFLYDWAGFYNAGVLDGSEWRERRFKIL